jgi:hypothetical protein
MYSISSSDYPPDNNGFVYKLTDSAFAQVFTSSNKFSLAWVPKPNPNILNPFELYVQYWAGLAKYRMSFSHNSEFGVSAIIDHKSWLIFGGSFKDSQNE